ncbi:MAG: hypothetical protein O7F11_08860 [Acidobacteria bacterium]|nr:hypothetical protein [Acidobacteriota bacterium]
MQRSADGAERSGKRSARRVIPGLLLVTMLVACLAAPVWAGDIELAWDAVPDPDVAGYRIYIGTAPGSSDQGIITVGKVTTLALTDLPDCMELYIGVKALDAGGQESIGFSDFVQGLAQPFVSDATPANLSQGEEDVLVTVQGGNFSSDMQRTDVQFDDPDIRVLSMDFIACDEIELHLSVGPFLSAPGDPGYNGAGDTVEEVPPAEIGSRGVTLTAPGALGEVIQGETPSALLIDFVPLRVDMDSSGRVDGFDLALFSRGMGSSFGGSEYQPELDMDGNKSVDGIDQAFFTVYWGYDSVDLTSGL